MRIQAGICHLQPVTAVDDLWKAYR